MSQFFNLSEVNDVKKLSISMSKFFKEQGFEEAKQSLFLEGFAKSLGHENWNTFLALNKEPKELTWDYHEYIHIDNGGYVLQYNISEEILKITTSFHGYSENMHRFKLSQKGVLEWSKSIDLMLSLINSEMNDEKKNEKIIENMSDYQEGSTSCGVNVGLIEIRNISTTISLYHNLDKVAEGLKTIAGLKSKIKTLNNKDDDKQTIHINLFQNKPLAKEKPNAFYLMQSIGYEDELKSDWGYKELSRKDEFKNALLGKDIVIANMAMRYRHDIGLLPIEVKEQVMNKMKVILFELSIESTNEEMIGKYPVKADIAQLREEYNYQIDKLKQSFKMK